MPIARAMRSTKDALRPKVAPELRHAMQHKYSHEEINQIELIAPLVLLHLSRVSGRPVLELACSLIDCTKSYEEKVGGSRGSK